jgi:hypothetical protein
MDRFWFLSLFCLLNFSILFGHEGHHGINVNKTTEKSISIDNDQPPAPGLEGRPKNWTQWFGGLHLILLHFPIALITMTAFAELLFRWYRRPVFDAAARFMLISAAILIIPTAIFGWILSYSTPFEGLLGDMLQLHMWFGILTAGFAIVVAFIREYKGRGGLYYASLLLLFLLVTITGSLGSGMTFGPYHMLPPVYNSL